MNSYEEVITKLIENHNVISQALIRLSENQTMIYNDLTQAYTHILQLQSEVLELKKKQKSAVEAPINFN